MKKLLGILAFSLILCGNAYSELLTLKKCHLINFKSSDGRKSPTFKSFKDSQKINNDLDDELYTLDTNAKTITHTIIWSQKAIDEHFEIHKTVLPKINKTIFKITDLGGNVATAVPKIKRPWFKEHKIDLDFKNAKVYTYVVGDLGAGEMTVTKTLKCTKQK